MVRVLSTACLVGILVLAGTQVPARSTRAGSTSSTLSPRLVLVPRAPQVAVAQPATVPTAAHVAADGAFAGRVAIGGGRKLYLACRGTGSPTVILESGYRNDADIWSTPVSHPPAVLPGVAAFTRPGLCL